MTTTPAQAGTALVLGLAAALAALALSGCAGASTGSSTSRAQLYTSLEEITDAADLVLTATAGAQDVVTDIPGSDLAFTITDLTVDQVLRTDDTTGTTATAAGGSTVVVRQTGAASGWLSSQPEATLEEGQRYLLFLVHSGLPGQAATQYYPVGVIAGIYQADGNAYTRAAPDSGDDLPTTLTPEQVRD